MTDPNRSFQDVFEEALQRLPSEASLPENLQLRPGESNDERKKRLADDASRHLDTTRQWTQEELLQQLLHLPRR